MFTTSGPRSIQNSAQAAACVFLPVQPGQSVKFQRIINYKTVESTQQIAKNIDRKQPTAISADIQTGGQGRAGRNWFSPEGGIWISFMIPYKKETQLNHYMTMIGALSVLRLLEKIGIPGSVRWPNDVVINDRKIAGILGEYYKKAVLCGIGINVNIYHFPTWIGPATSLALEMDQTFQVNELRGRLIRIFEQIFVEFEQSGGRTIIRLLRPYFTSSGDFVTVNYGRNKVSGVVQDIDDEGALILRTETDQLLRIFSGELRRVKWS